MMRDLMTSTVVDLRTELNALNRIADRNQKAVDHYTAWEDTYDGFDDKDSAIRSTAIAMRCNQASSDLKVAMGQIKAAVQQIDEAYRIASEGELR